MSAPSDGARGDARKRLVEAAERTADEIGKSIAAASGPIEAEIKVQLAASWLVFAHLVESESGR